MPDYSNKFYVNGQWVTPHDDKQFDVVNPASEEKICQVSSACSKDVDDAVAAARAAFPAFSRTSVVQRKELLGNIVSESLLSR